MTTTTKPSLNQLTTQDLFDMINALASRYYGTYGRKNKNSSMISIEDLAAQGSLAATTAYSSFNPALATNPDLITAFRTHAYPYIKNAMLTYCKKFSHPLSISEKSARDEWGNVTSIGIIHIDQTYADSEDGQEQFDIPVGSGVEVLGYDAEEYFFAGFSDFERSLIKGYILDEYSLQELANQHKLSKSRVGEIIRNLTDRMKCRAECYE